MYNDNVRMHRYLRANHFKLIEMMGYLPVDQMIQVPATLEDAGMRALAQIQGQSSNDQGGFAGRPPDSFVARGTVYITYIYRAFAGRCDDDY